MAIVTNTSKARQGVRMGGVLCWIRPGASRDGDMSEQEIALASRHSFLSIEGDASAAKLPGLTGKSKDQLLEIAKAESVDVPDGATNPQIVEAIEAKRAAS